MQLTALGTSRQATALRAETSAACPAPHICSLRNSFAGFNVAQTNRPLRRNLVSAALPPVVCVTNVSESDFDQAVLKEKGKTVLVDFWATWCGPCKLIDPFMKQLEEEFGDKLKVVKVEADPNPALVEKYKVYGLPTLILFKDGNMIKGSLNEGAITKPALLKYLEKYGIAKVAK